MNNLKIFPKSTLGLLLFVFILSFPFIGQAQFFTPYVSPSPFPPPPIRTTPFQVYDGTLQSPFLSPIFLPPVPVTRSANALITLWNTVGTANTLIVYNPTALIGVSAAPVTPSPLLSLIAGTLANTALLTSNPAFYNFLVNTYLLPTGLAIYAFP
ncbi:MAG: hypothetical protein ACMUJM_14760 [bacterium]